MLGASGIVRRLFATQAVSKWQARVAKLDTLFISTISRFHEISGYSQIEQLKQKIDTTDHEISAMRARVRDARMQYTTLLNERQVKQKEINELLMRKQAWKPLDLEKFTQLYKDDHLVQQNVANAKSEYESSEQQLEELQMSLSKLMSARYREEQLWSDRIRQASTWGTFILMGINILLFVIVQLVLEPWKRRRLLRAFEERITKENAIRAEHAESAIKSTDGVYATGSAASNLAADAAEQLGAAPLHSDGPEPLRWDTLLERLAQPELVVRPAELMAISGASLALATLCSLAVLAFSK